MPKNKRESLIYTVIMCFAMVLVMSIYNVSVSSGELSVAIIKSAWLGFPFAFVVALICDWFIVSRPAKAFAFKFIVKQESTTIKKIISISCCMVIPMVIIMSLYGTLSLSIGTGIWENFLITWGVTILKNAAMALPLQLLIAGPIVRKLFRTAFPEGTVLA